MAQQLLIGPLSRLYRGRPSWQWDEPRAAKTRPPGEGAFARRAEPGPLPGVRRERSSRRSQCEAPRRPLPRRLRSLPDVLTPLVQDHEELVRRVRVDQVGRIRGVAYLDDRVVLNAPGRTAR